MNSVFATATGNSVSISPESLARARITLSHAPNFNDEALSTSQSPLKSAKSGAPVPVDPESLKVIKRKFADYDDDSCQSPAKKQAGEELDYSSLFRRAGSGKAIEISESALSVAKRTMGTMGPDENGSGGKDEPSLTSMVSTTSIPSAAAATSTTPLRSTPQSSLLHGRRPRFNQSGGGSSQFKSPFNSPFRPPIVASPNGFSSSLVARPSPSSASANPATPVTTTASPLSRMCLNSPASSSGGHLSPIASLSANNRNFTIRVKVTERTGSIIGYGPNGEGRFCCWLSDATEMQQPAASSSPSTATPAARLEAEGGGAAAEKIAAVLQYGKIYDIQSGRLSVRRPAPDNPRGIVLFFDERTQVKEVPSPSFPPISRQRHRSSLVPLSDVRKEGEIDIAGIVGAVSPSMGSSPSKGGIPSPSDGIPSIHVTLVDQRASLTLTLPYEYSKAELNPGDLLLVYRASARTINGSGVMAVSAVRGRTKLLLNPETEDGRVVALSNWSRCGQWAAVGGRTKMRSIASVEEKVNDEGERREYDLATKAMVVNVDAADEATVEECVMCRGRIGKNRTRCDCTGERGIVTSLQLDVDLSDGTGVIRATASGEVAEALVGVETTEAMGMLRWNRDEWRSQCRRVHYESRVFRLRRDESTPNRLSIVEVLPVPYEAYHILISKKLTNCRKEHKNSL